MSTELYKMTKSEDVVKMQEEIIDNNLTHRKSWEEDCRSVMYSYRGNKFPVKIASKAGSNTNLSSSVTKSKDKKGYINLVKRQYRVMANYLLNNEPQYILSKKEGGVTEGYLGEVREALNLVFDYGDDDDMGFYDTVMDETIFFGVHRGIAWTMVYFDKETKQFRFRSFDPMDTYIDLDVNRLSEVKKFISTYTVRKTDLQRQYLKQHFGEPIDWDRITADKESSLSNTKQSTLIEFEGKESMLIREGYYIDYKGSEVSEDENGEQKETGESDELYLWRVKSTKTLCLEMECIAPMKTLPVTWFSPLGEPGEKYPRSWFADMLELEREVNDLIQKMSTIIKTGGRYVYVRSGTKITRSTSNFLNSLGIEVLEVAESQEIPQQANLLNISQSDIQFLDILLRQAEEEGGMKSDIMGTSSSGPGASGRAIQALQAGSKNNIGTALIELNKYMTRLTRILVRMFKIFPSGEYFSEEKEEMIQPTEDYNEKVKIKVSITGRDAFDEVTQVLNAIDILNMIQKFDPSIKISPSVITKLMGVTNEIADDIQDELDKQENPDLQIAEGQAKKLLQGIPVNASESDDHQIFIAIFSEALKNVPQDSPAAQVLIQQIKIHEAFLQSNQQPQ